MKLFFKLVPLIVIPIIVFALAYHLTFAYILSETILDSTIMEAEGIIEIAARDLQNPVYFLDVDEITSIIKNMEATSFVVSVIILDSTGMVITDGTNENPNVGKIPEDDFTLKAIASDERTHYVHDHVLRVSSPIIITDRLGTILVDFTLGDYENIVRDSQDIIITITLVVALVSSSIAFFFSRNISIQIKNVQTLSHNIAEGNFDHKIKTSDIEEIKNLGDDLKVMTQRLENTKNELVKSERLSSIG